MSNVATMTRARATAVGFGAVVMWSLLAVLTVGSAPVPPFQLNAMTFTTGGAIGLIWLCYTGGISRLRGVDWRVYAFGTFGLFAYHALYFSALRIAPAAEAGLIAYLWPLFIVLFSGLLPGEKLGAGHVLGAVAAGSGAAIILLRGGFAADGDVLPGLALAFLAAITWASYSIISRKLGKIPTGTVAVFCIATAILSAAVHVGTETTVWPLGWSGWLACLALGLGPVGLAFYLWDIGVKHGDIQLLGVASYAAPLLSTLVLIVAGFATPSLHLLIAAVLITGGAALAARASARKFTLRRAA